MIRTVLSSVLFLLLILAFTITLVACRISDEGAESSSEESVSEWETEPAPETPNEDSNEDYQKCEHKYKNGYCSLCGEKGGATDDLHFLPNGDGTWRVAGIGECTDIHIVIPLKSPNGEPVTKIGYRAFAWYETMETIVIHENITVIDLSAFHDCLSLKSAEFEDPDGWYCDGKPVSLSDPRLNVSILLNGEKLEKLVETND